MIYCIGDILEYGYVLYDATDGHVRFRPGRGSGGYSIWKTRRNALAACRLNEKPVPVDLKLEHRPIESLVEDE